jgi:hypothetical protein
MTRVILLSFLCTDFKRQSHILKGAESAIKAPITNCEAQKSSEKQIATNVYFIEATSFFAETLSQC